MMNQLIKIHYTLSKTLCILPNKYCYINVNNYATKKGGMGKFGAGGKLGAQIAPKMKLPVEKDPEKLLNYVCGSNIYKEGEDIKLKDDKEYPDWLWTLRTGPPPPLSEMDPNTLQYWKRVQKLGIRRANKLRKGKKF